MEKFRIGQVVKLKYLGIIVITSVLTDRVHWVSFDSGNCSGITRINPYTETHWSDDIGGEYEKQHSGMSEAVVLAQNCKEYIIKRVLKNFDF